MEHVVKILDTKMVTHNVKQFKVEKPSGYDFIPGQATDISINTAELKDELRPFTFTSLPDDPFLEFTIKIYKGHNGITEKLGELSKGDELILHDVFGTISYHGPGLFIAGGAGITPFIAIFRHLHRNGGSKGNKLLFANHTEADIVLGNELKAMLNGGHHDILHSPVNTEIPPRIIDKALLSKHLINDTDAYYYVCGPDPFTAAMIDHLKSLGIDESKIIYEK